MILANHIKMKTVVFLLVILAAVAVRVMPFYFFCQQPRNTQDELLLFNFVDSCEYNGYALEINKNGFFSFVAQNKDPVLARRTPGYPLFLAAIYGLFGNNFCVVLFVQVIIDLCSAVLVYLITKTLFGLAAPALVSASLFAFNPQIVHQALSLYPETLFILFLLAGLFVFIKAIKKPATWKFAILGFCLGYSTLIKPWGIYSWLLFAVVLFVSAFSLRQKMKYIFFVILLFTLTAGAWQARNYALWGRFSLCSDGGDNLLRAYVGDTRWEIERRDFSYEFQHLVVPGPNPFVTDDLEAKEAYRYLFQHPLEYGHIAVGRLLRSFGPDRKSADEAINDGNYWGSSRVLSSAIVKSQLPESFISGMCKIWNAVVFLQLFLFLIGLFVMCSSWRLFNTALLFLMLQFYYFLIIGTIILPRYLSVQDVFIAIVSGGSVALLVNKFSWVKGY